MAWNDEDVSSSSLQTSPKLLNDLDLVVIAPDGSTYLGNDFANGVSTVGGSADVVNNLERIRINPTTSSHLQQAYGKFKYIIEVVLLKTFLL